MHNVLAVAWRDIKRVAANPVAIAITIGILIIPSAYAWFNIAANWDPYQNTSEIGVCLVNEDTGTTLDDKRLNIGDEVVTTLKSNHELDWRFVSEDDALEQVKSGEAYAALVIPEDFSREVTSILSGTIEHASITYYVNEKVNPVAPKVTDTGASTVEETINEEFVESVTSVVVNAVKSGSASLTSKTDTTTANALERLEQTQAALTTVTTMIASTRTTITQAHDAILETDDACNAIYTAIDEAQSSLAQVKSTLQTARSSVGTLAGKLSSALVDAAGDLTSASGTTSQALKTAAGAVSEGQSTLKSAINRLEAAKDQGQKAYDELEKAASALPEGELKTTATQNLASLKQTLTTAQNALDTLNATSSSLGADASELNTLAGDTTREAHAAASALTREASTITTTIAPDLENNLSNLESLVSTLSGTLTSLKPLVQTAQNSLGQLASTLTEANTALGATATSCDSLMQSLSDVQKGLGSISTSQLYQTIASLTNLNTQDIASVMSTPVSIVDKAVFSVANYGSGVAPFYTNLALFVGGLMLTTIYKLTVDDEGIEGLTPTQAYFGRLLLLDILSVVQALICCTGDLVMGIQCVSPGGFLLVGIVASVVYTNIIYALTLAFKHIGKALEVVLIILQIPGSSGLYPIEMQPAFFQHIYPWLPFTYGIAAMRETIAGYYGWYYVQDLAILLLYVLPALLIGVVLRRHITNMDALFDNELTDSQVFIGEHATMTAPRMELTTLVAAALEYPQYKEEIERQLTAYEQRYPKLLRGGVIVMIAVTPLDLLIARLTGAKLLMLLIWVIAMVLCCIYFVVVEYFHVRLQDRSALLDAPQEERLALLNERLAAKKKAPLPETAQEVDHE